MKVIGQAMQNLQIECIPYIQGINNMIDLNRTLEMEATAVIPKYHTDQSRTLITKR